MLTFKTAPKTLLGPCEHALWQGAVFLSRHHIHMPNGVTEWKAAVVKLLEDGAAADLAAKIVTLNKAMGEFVQAGRTDGAYVDALKMWSKVTDDLHKMTSPAGL